MTALTKRQREALEWLGGDCREPLAIDGRVWNNLVGKGLATQWRGHLTLTRAGRELLRELRRERSTHGKATT